MKYKKLGMGVSKEEKDFYSKYVGKVVRILEMPNGCLKDLIQ